MRAQQEGPQQMLHGAAVLCFIIAPVLCFVPAQSATQPGPNGVSLAAEPIPRPILLARTFTQQPQPNRPDSFLRASIL